MLRRLRSSTWGGSLSAAEVAAMEQLVATGAEMAEERPNADGQSETGHASCGDFLACVESLACSMGLEAVDRSYRGGFSANYRALFPDGARRYRADVLEASADHHAAIWVNGDKFELSAEAVASAVGLQQAWAQVGELVDRWRASQAGRTEVRPSRNDLSSALNSLDALWAKFEHRYVSELIAIEGKARQVLLRAVEQEAALRRVGRQRNGPEHREAQQRLVACISKLNAVANFRRKGRDDLGMDILDAALEVLRQCEGGMANTDPDADVRAARCLAADVVESFEAMCKYFRSVSRCLERVDPHLCNNAGLVARLVDWEESWEVGAKYVRDTPLLRAICDTVNQAKESQEFSPSLQEMLDDCDAELFLVLPRLVWLYYIAEPTRARAALVRHLLPHRFVARSACAQPVPGKELQGFVDHFQRVTEQLGRGTQKALERLTKRAIAGSFEVADPTPKSEEAARKHRAVESLMRELESWSLELQRHCPEDWNQCSALVIQCLQQTEPVQSKGEEEFQV